MESYNNLKINLQKNPMRWLITGVAGFIGSNLLEELLSLNQIVIGVDNFSTGHQINLDDVRGSVGEKKWSNFTFFEGDTTNFKLCQKACEAVDYVLHQAALGSVPRSINNPIATNQSNVEGFLNILVAAKDANVKRFVYASSSSIYGDHPDLPKKENKFGRQLSPYAVTKYVNELYSDVFAQIYGFQTIGLRYFNVFGKRQDPKGAYAAVIPKWILSFLNGDRPIINGKGDTSRDFCYIKNVIQANLLSATTNNPEALNQLYNVAYGERTTLNQLFQLIKDNLILYRSEISLIEASYGPYRKGDVHHSLADITKAETFLGYKPQFDVEKGINETVRWYTDNLD